MVIGSVKNKASVLPKVQAESTGNAAKADAPKKQGWVAEMKQKIRADVNAIGLTAYAPLKAPPVLKRPVVMIPGLTMPATSFDPLARNLATEKQNGPVATYVAADGQFHYGGKDGRAMGADELKNVKIFQMEYKDAKAAPSAKAPQIADMMKKIEAVTGQHDVDVVTHSAGGTDFRDYLDTRQDQDMHIGKLVMIGPVTHGTTMGNIGSVAGGPLGLKDASDELGIGDPMVKHLDETWPKQRAQIGEGVTIVGVTGAPTMGPGGSIKTGDGYVQAAQLALPGADVKTVRGADPTPIAHLREVGYSGVIDEVQSALGK
jgi:pimeloyl-ACP methyl ester carboxylesterase